MKKLLSLLTAAAMMLSLSATAFADSPEGQEAPDSDKLVQALSERFDIQEYNFDYIYRLTGDNDGAWFFCDRINEYEKTSEKQSKVTDLYERRIGNYVFESRYVKAPYELGMYVYKDGKAYTLEEANEQSVISMDKAVEIINSNRNIVYSFRIEGSCEEAVKALREKYKTDDLFNLVKLGEYQDAWLCYDDRMNVAFREQDKKIGDWTFKLNDLHPYYELGLYVYKDGKAYTLEEACENGIFSVDFAVELINYYGTAKFTFGIESDNEDVVKAFRKRYSLPDSAVFKFVKLGEDGASALYFNDTAIVRFMQYDVVIGDWTFDCYQQQAQYDLGLYVYNDGNIYTLAEANEKNLFSIDKAVEYIRDAKKANSEQHFTFGIKGKYEDAVQAFRKKYSIPDTSLFQFVKLGEDGTSALYFNDTGIVHFMQYDVVIGDWTFDCYQQQAQYDLGLYVYNDVNIYTLAEANEKNLFSIDKAVEYIKAADGQHFTFSIKGKAEKPAISAKKLTLKSGAETALAVQNGEVKSWKTSDKRVATVKNGTVTALNKGKAKITAILTSGEKLTCKVTVTTAPKLGKTAVKVKKNSTVKLRLTGRAKNINNKYTNTKYAKFTSPKNADTLVIKGIKKGTSTLKVRVNGAVTLKIKVTVK